MPTINYVAKVSNNGDGLHRSYDIPVELTKQELAALAAGGQGAGDVLRKMLRIIQPQIISTEQWLCRMCGQRASTMVNTPGFYPHPATGGPPVVVDMMPLQICSDPACNQQAQRETQRLMRGVNTAMEEESPGFNLRAGQAYECAHCKKVQSRDAGKMEYCSKCKAVRYCSRACQAADWKVGHKRVCVAATCVATPHAEQASMRSLHESSQLKSTQVNSTQLQSCGERMLACSACGVDHPEDQYSSSQLKKHASRRCRACVDQVDAPSTSTSVQHPTSGPVAEMSSAPLQMVSMADLLGEVTMQVGSYMCWASGEILDPLNMVFVLDPFCQDSALPEAWTAAAEAPYPALRLRALFGPNVHGGVFWRRPSGKMAEVSLLRRRTRDGAVAIAMNSHWVDHTAEAARYLNLGSAASVAPIAELLAEVVDDTVGRSLLTAQKKCIVWHPAVIDSVFTRAGPGGVVGSIQSRGAGSTQSRAVGFGHPDLEIMAFTLLFPEAQGGFREPLPEGPASSAQRAALERYASLRFRSVCSWWWSDSLYRLFMRGALMRAGADARIATEPEAATTHAVELRYLNGPPRLQSLQEACAAGE